MTDVVIQPVIPIWAIVCLLLMALASLWWTYGRCLLSLKHRCALIGLRLAALLLLGTLLLQPELLRVETREEPPVLAVLIDRSASMQDAPGEDSMVRATNAKTFLSSRAFRAASRDYDLRWYTVGGDLEPLDERDVEGVTFTAPRTHLVDGLNEVGKRLRATNLAGVVLLSDGLDQSTSDLAIEARRAPVFIPALSRPYVPSETTETDVWIDQIAHPKMLVVNWQGQIEVTVRRRGDGRLVCPVHLSRRGERIRSGYATFEPGSGMQQVTFSIEPTVVGRTTYRVELEPPADADPANNVRQFVIDVTDPKNRILYLEGTPRWEFKFVKRALLKEQNYYISAFIQSGEGVFVNFSEEADASSLDQLPSFTRQQLLDYRVIILGEMAAAALDEDQQQALHDYVEQGGGLLFLGGSRAYGDSGWPASSTMKTLLPFTNGDDPRMLEGRLSVAPTEVGRNHPVLAGLMEEAGFPAVLSLWGPVVKRPIAIPLLEAADGAPLLLAQRYGEGKTAAILSDSVWRWQLGAPAAMGDKSLYDRFMSQLVHWLAPRQENVAEGGQLQVFTASGEAEVGERVAIGAIVGETGQEAADFTLTATITLPDQRELKQQMTTAKLGQEVGLEQELWGWRTEVVPPMPGEYRIRVEETGSGAEQQTLILVAEPQLEITGQALDRDYLQAIARQTGGSFREIEDWPDLWAELPFEPLTIRSTTQRPLWNNAWVLVLLLFLFVAEWFLRSKLDLV